MDLDAMETGIYIWKGLTFSITTCYRSIRNHPFVFGIACLFFLLYRFLHPVFEFLVSSLPLIVCTAVLLKTLLSFGDDHAHNAKKEEIRTRKVSFRTSKGGDESKGEDEDEAVMIEEKRKDNLSKSGKLRDAESSKSGSYRNDRFFPDDLQANNNQELEELQLLLDSEPSESALISPNDANAASDSEGESQEEAEDEEGKGGQEDGTKVVAWTEDDEKNLTDLGTSEIERNQRLENLIAKRRARKFLRMQLIEKNLIDLDSNDPSGQIAPISTGRSNPFNLPQYYSNETPDLLPGSAPSILLPTRNPFDLPYDPLEERPNLMGNSFQQEFMPEPKDMYFCRHESFRYGPLFSGELNQEIPSFVTRQIASDGTVYSRFQKQLDQIFHEKLIEQRSSEDPNCSEQEGQVSEQVNDLVETKEGNRDLDLGLVKINGEDKEITNETESSLVDTSEVHVKQGLVEEEFGGLRSSPASSEMNEQIVDVKKDEGSDNPELKMDDPTSLSRNSMQISVTDSRSKSGEEVEGQIEDPVYDSSPTAIEKTTIEESLFYEDKGVVLSSAFSKASGLQVGVPEVDLSPAPVGRTILLADGESYDGEGVWTATSNLCGVDNDELRSREIMEISERDILEVGFSVINKNSDDTIASAMQPQSAVEQVPAADSQEKSLLKFNPEIPVEIQQVDVEEMEIPVASSSSDGLTLEQTLLEEKKVQPMMEDLTAQPFSGIEFENLQELSYPPAKSIEEDTTLYNANELETVSENEGGKENLKSTEENESESQILIKEAAIEDLVKLAEASDESKLFEDIEGEPEKLPVHEVSIPVQENETPEFIQHAEEDQNSEVIEDVEGKSDMLTDHEESKLNEENHNSVFSKDVGGKSVKLIEYEASKPVKENDNFIESEFQILIKHEAIEDLLKLAEDIDGKSDMLIDHEESKLNEENHNPVFSKDVGGKSDKLIEHEASKPVSENDNFIESESQILIKHEAIGDLLKLAEASDELKLFKDTEREPEKLTVHEASIPAQENDNPQFIQHTEENHYSKVIGDVERESDMLTDHEEPKLNEEYHNSVFSKDGGGKSDKLIEDGVSKPVEENDNFIESESQILIKHAAVEDLLKLAEASDELKLFEEMEGEPEKLTVHEASIAAQENDNQQFIQHTEENHYSKVIEDVECESDDNFIESESQILIKHEAIDDLLKLAEASDESKLFEDIEGEPEKLTVHEASIPVQENDNPEFIQHTEENHYSEVIEDVEGKSDMLTDHEESKLNEENHNSVFNKDGGGESDKLIEYEASKPVEENDNFIESESQVLIKHAAVEDLLKLAEASDESKLFEDIEGEPEKLNVHEASIPVQENDQEFIQHTEENHYSEVIEDVEIIKHAAVEDLLKLAEASDESKLFKDIKAGDEPEKFSEDKTPKLAHEDGSKKHEASKPAEENDSAEFLEDYSRGVPEKLNKNVIPKASKENDSSESTINVEGNSEKLPVYEPKPVQESDNSDFVKDTESKSDKLIEDEVSNKEEENDSSDFIKDIEGKSSQLSDHDESKADRENENSPFIEGESRRLTEHKASSPVVENNSSEFVEHIRGESEEMAENEAIDDQSRPTKDEDQRKSPEDAERESQELIDEHVQGDGLIENESIWIPAKATKSEAREANLEVNNSSPKATKSSTDIQVLEMKSLEDSDPSPKQLCETEVEKTVFESR